MPFTGCGDEGSSSSSESGGSGSAADSDGGSGNGNGDADETGATGADSEGLDPNDADPEFSDEFDDASTLSEWMRGHEVEDREAQYSTMDIDGATTGQLTIIPTREGWFGDFDGPLLFKMTSGDFIVETLVTAANTEDPEAAPTQFFNSAGLLVRNPTHGPGQENWIMHNVGYQAEFVGTEGKTTVESESMLTLVPGERRGRLRVCRVGDRFVLARRLDGENSFRATHEFTRSDLPDEVQVGLVASGWNAEGFEPDTSITPDIAASFDYIRLWRPSSEGDCLAD